MTDSVMTPEMRRRVFRRLDTLDPDLPPNETQALGRLLCDPGPDVPMPMTLFAACARVELFSVRSAVSTIFWLAHQRNTEMGICATHFRAALLQGALAERRVFLPALLGILDAAASFRDLAETTGGLLAYLGSRTAPPLRQGEIEASDMFPWPRWWCSRAESSELSSAIRKWVSKSEYARSAAEEALAKILCTPEPREGRIGHVIRHALSSALG